MTIEDAQNPFVGPRSLEAGDGIYGRDEEIRELRWFFTAERIVWLHSPSGAGKTSLIQAGLIPELVKDDFEVLPLIRVSRESSAGGNRYEQSVLACLGADSNLDDFLAAGEGSKSRVLIFDQFEEVLTLDSTDLEAKKAFFEWLGRTLQLPDIWALFVVREDFLPALDPYVGPIPTLMNHRFRLELLSVANAQEAMQQIAARGRRKFSPEAIALLGPELARILIQSGGREEWRAGRVVEPVILQVVCRSMWNEIPWDDRTIEAKHIPTGDKVQKSLKNFYATGVKSVSTTTAQERRVRAWVGEKLIVTGFRNQVLDVEGDGAGLGLQLAAGLEKTHLIRREERGDRTWYELQHDRLVAPVLADNQRWAEENLHWVQRRADLWNQLGQPKASLVSDEDLRKAERWIAESRPELTPVETKFLAQSREEQKVRDKIRRRTVLAWIAAGVASALCLVATFFYLGARSRELMALALGEVRDNRVACAVADGANGLRLAQYLGPTLRHNGMEALSEVLQGSPAPYELGSGAVRLAYSPAAHLLALASDDQVNLYNTQDAEHKKQYTWTVEGCSVTRVALRPDGGEIAIGLTSGETIRRDIPGGGEIKCATTAGEPAAIQALAYSSKGELASAHANRVEIDGRPIAQMDAVALAFRPDGAMLAAGLRSGSVRILDPNGAQKMKLHHSDSPVTSLAWAHDTLAGVSRHVGAVRVWSDDGSVKWSLEGKHVEGYAGVAISANGSLAAILGLSDHQIEMWMVASRAPWLSLETPPAENAEPAGAVFLDTRRLLVGYNNGKVRLFALDAEGLKEAAAALLKVQSCSRP